MQIDSSTANVLLVSIVALQSWAVREIYGIKNQVSNLQTRLDIHEKQHNKNPSCDT